MFWCRHWTIDRRCQHGLGAVDKLPSYSMKESCDHLVVHCLVVHEVWCSVVMALSIQQAVLWPPCKMTSRAGGLSFDRFDRYCVQGIHFLGSLAPLERTHCNKGFLEKRVTIPELLLKIKFITDLWVQAGAKCLVCLGCE